MLGSSRNVVSILNQIAMDLIGSTSEKRMMAVAAAQQEACPSPLK